MGIKSARGPIKVQRGLVRTCMACWVIANWCHLLCTENIRIAVVSVQVQQFEYPPYLPKKGPLIVFRGFRMDAAFADFWQT